MLRQIKVRYDTLEDRLLLSLETQDRRHHLLLTRRVWGQVRPALQQLLNMSAAAPAELPAVVQQGISAVHHRTLAAQQSTSREAVAERGVPDQAALVVELKLGQRKATVPRADPNADPNADASTDAQRWVMVFRLHERPELRLVLNDGTMHGLVSALLEREDAAAWGLPILPARTATPLEQKHTIQ